MARNNRNWNTKFIEYMEMIVNNPNYKGLPIERKKDGSLKWIATAKSEIGQKRIQWANNKAIELGFKIRAGVYADVMLAIHPTKYKVCQTCGGSMSLYYHYPNANFLKSINKTFNTNFTECDHISKIWDKLIEFGNSQEVIAKFIVNKSNLKLDYKTAEKDEIICALEYMCRKNGKKRLGPGAMSNFPDRYDGFHTYNRCCRSTQDTGRSKENLKSYTKDRRAYEYWSDGNIHAANQFMGSSFFYGTSADHIGPISLGFVHDPHYMQPMLSGDNSSKRDRLQVVDIENIIKTEKRTGIYPMSWYSKLIWEFIKTNYNNNKTKVPTLYRNALKQNMINFMYILRYILESCPKNGKKFLVDAFLKPNYECFKYSYQFNSKGEIINRTPRHYTGRNQNEKERYVRIAIASVFDYTGKDNRNNKPDLTASEILILKELCKKIEQILDFDSNKKFMVTLIEKIQNRIILSL